MQEDVGEAVLNTPAIFLCSSPGRVLLEDMVLRSGIWSF